MISLGIWSRLSGKCKNNNAECRNWGKYDIDFALTFCRIRSSYLHPFSFEEFLLALEKEMLLQAYRQGQKNIPLGAGANFKRRRMLLLDTGIFLRTLNFNASQIITAEDFKTINMGSLVEMFTGLEILKASSCYMPYQLYCWHREKKQSNAQVDYVIQKNNMIVPPIEVKSGVKGATPSLHLFMQEKNSKVGVRCSFENFGVLGKVEIYPVYAISNVILDGFEF
ncbi:MAG: DUF4143 domain-containing protein [Chitinispirillales bacterium]|jgi:predicted AAA+ superfamily ATPase|nr:DUF4143 domain-containing protein [Chitinispirillales bacterium]